MPSTHGSVSATHSPCRSAISGITLRTGSNVVKGWLAFAGLLVMTVALAAQTAPSEFFADRVPRWFPVPKIPADNPITEEKVELGRHLFYVPLLSCHSTTSCATCHKQPLASTDRQAQSIGSTGGQHPRSSMSLANVAYNASYGWNDRTWSLESQMMVPMHNEHPIEMGLKGNEEEVIERFRADADYIARFRAAFP